MKLLAVFVLSCVLVLCQGQTRTCQTDLPYACVSRNEFQECDSKSNLKGVVHTCSSMGTSEDFVCYGAASDPDKVCGAPPPPCNASGNFPIPKRCRNFYTCVANGNRFFQYISECNPGFEFSPKGLKCVTTKVAGCSIPLPAGGSSSDSETTNNGTNCQVLTRYPDPSSCNHYFQCFLLGRRNRFQCPFNMLYDIPSKSCRSQTSCEDRPIQSQQNSSFLGIPQLGRK